MAKDHEMEKFLNKTTPWKEAATFLFTDSEGVTGLFRKEPEYSGRAWSTKILSEGQDWSTSLVPKFLPSSSVGSYSFLISPSAFDFEKDPKALIHDFLWPWDLRKVSKTHWIKHENGTIRIAYSRHGTYRHIRRYISYVIGENDELPNSNVLFQYIVGPIENSEDNDEEQPTSSKRSKEEDSAWKEKQKKEKQRRKSENEKLASKTKTAPSEGEMGKFSDKFTPWEEDGCYKFLENGVTGLYRKEPEYSGRAWALKILTETTDWTTSKIPTNFPLNCVGSYRYLVAPCVFELDPKAIVNDLFFPWDGPGTHTRWSNTDHENGNIRHGTSKHLQYRNIRRYITYFSDNENLPISPVLYQYIVEPPAEEAKAQKPSTSKNKSNSEKRKRESSEDEESDDSEWEDTPKRIVKRRKSDANKTGFSKNTQRLRKTKKEGKVHFALDTVERPLVNEYAQSTPSPPISEPFVDTPLSSRKHSEPVFVDLEQTLTNLQRSISEMKKRYCSLANPSEMTAMNQKIIRLLGLESEVKNRIASLAEYTKNMTAEIMDMPSFQRQLPSINGNSEMDTPQRHVVVKIE